MCGRMIWKATQATSVPPDVRVVSHAVKVVLNSAASSNSFADNIILLPQRAGHRLGLAGADKLTGFCQPAQRSGEAQESLD